ncbi:hypothetical protein GCM10010206_49050 [Streptomyces cinerochromogenes]|nr:hypothetical protein GCM10010206_49050 [Streptomyces cinerochromogenes]
MAVVNDALTVRQHLEYFKVAYGLPHLRRAEEVMEELHFSEYADERGCRFVRGAVACLPPASA